MEIKEYNIKNLKKSIYNPRKLSNSQYDDLKKSLIKFGCVDPIIINKEKGRENIIIGGHQRLKIWKDLGNNTIPCVEVFLSEEDEKELNIRLNKNTGDWDYDILKSEFDIELLKEWGFDDFNIEDEEDKKIIDKEIEEKYEILIKCEDEIDQEQKYQFLNENGIKCQLLTL